MRIVIELKPESVGQARAAGARDLGEHFFPGMGLECKAVYLVSDSNDGVMSTQVFEDRWYDEE